MRRAHQIIVGLALTMALAAVSAQAQAEEFQAQPLARLFTVPSGRVLSSMEVLLTLGGAYGSMNKGEYLGRASLGLGDFAELEVSTWRLVSNLFNGTASLGTTALSVGVLRPEEGSLLPDASICFRMNPSWKKVEVRGNDLAENLRDDVNEVNFEMHFASLYLNLSRELIKDVTLHAGVYLTDMRTRSGMADRADSANTSGSVAIPDAREDMVGGFAGLERKINPRTILMAEIFSVPRFKYTLASNELKIDQVTMFIAGVRFHFARRISTDAGVKYRSDYKGIADSEITVGLNFGFNLEEAFKSVVK